MNGHELRIKFDEEWGIFRKYIAANPLTGFWLGVVAGATLGGVVSAFL